MTNLILPKRSRLSSAEMAARARNMEHLLHASKDINDWSFHIVSAPSDAPRTCNHVFEGRDKRTGIIQPFKIDVKQADENGNYEREHMRIIEAFTESLLWLDQTIKEHKARIITTGKSSLALPSHEFNIAMAAKEALHRGDHPNTFKS